jgi:DNA-binding NarL/FixJ family response regulator
MKPIHVLIAEDDPLTRLGIRSLLERYPDEYHVLGEAVTGEQAVALAEEHQPDLIIMDIRMPKMDGLEATRQITTMYPRTYVLILTMVDETESLFAALRHGAMGYLVKGADQEETLQAIRAVSVGQAVFSPKMAKRLLHYFGTLRYQPDVMPPLSARETEVLSLMANSAASQKYMVDEISEKLVVARHTVQNHISNILVKLQVLTKAEAIQIWRDWERRRDESDEAGRADDPPSPGGRHR